MLINMSRIELTELLKHVCMYVCIYKDKKEMLPSA